MLELVVFIYHFQNYSQNISYQNHDEIQVVSVEKTAEFSFVENGKYLFLIVKVIIWIGAKEIAQLDEHNHVVGAL